MDNIIVNAAKKKSQKGVAKKSNPSLWSRCKADAKAKMGGKWSARAAQYAVQLYKKRGGKYKGKKPTAKTNKLKKWTKQKWMYLSDYKKKQKKKAFDAFSDALIILAESKNNPGRYLPEAKWRSLSPKERSATDAKKKKQGKNKQYVANTEKAKVRSSAKYYADDQNYDIDYFLEEFDLM
jgi:hypothetical protein